MSKPTTETLMYIVLGAATSGGLELLFKAIGFLLAGILGALGGWITNKFIVPYLNRSLPRIKSFFKRKKK